MFHLVNGNKDVRYTVLKKEIKMKKALLCTVCLLAAALQTAPGYAADAAAKTVPAPAAVNTQPLALADPAEKNYTVVPFIFTVVPGSDTTAGKPSGGYKILNYSHIYLVAGEVDRFKRTGGFAYRRHGKRGHERGTVFASL